MKGLTTLFAAALAPRLLIRTAAGQESALKNAYQGCFPVGPRRSRVRSRPEMVKRRCHPIIKPVGLHFRCDA
jgi:hypothetical protein